MLLSSIYISEHQYESSIYISEHQHDENNNMISALHLLDGEKAHISTCVSVHVYPKARISTCTY